MVDDVFEAQQIGVLGAGVMGGGIAQVLAVAGHDVVCCDISGEALRAGREAIEKGRFGIRRSVESGRLDADAGAAALGRVTFTEDRDALGSADMVIEAVPERLDLKISVFRELDRLVQPGGILASNTSGFSIGAMGAATDRPELVIGWHWASPAPVMKLAEIVRGPQTSDETVRVVTALAARAGKNPIVVTDQPRTWGHVANRVYSAMAREARRVVEEGLATPEEVDQLLVDCYRMPVGPLAMSGGATSGWKK